MPSTRAQVLEALELAGLVLAAADIAANYREPFVELMALDPGLVVRGRGRRAGRILTAVLVALRERDGRSETGSPDAQETA